MAREVIFPSRNRPPGNDRSVDIVVPLGAEQVFIYAVRSTWPDTSEEVIGVVLDLSLDGGTTWIDNYLGFGAIGGERFEPVPPFGLVPDSYASRDLPDVGSLLRRVRINMDTKSRITTNIDVDFV